jgi:hypothetical protein
MLYYCINNSVLSHTQLIAIPRKPETSYRERTGPPELKTGAAEITDNFGFDICHLVGSSM